MSLNPKPIILSRLWIIVAIIDTGGNLEHPSLKARLWVNPKEVLDQKDNDQNSCRDDLHGWNFAGDSADISDYHGHGTHIAGIVAQAAPEARLMILKYYDTEVAGKSQIAATAQAIRYAVHNGAKIINYSAGGDHPDPDELMALQEAERQGVLVVAAAGNQRRSNDHAGYYPASYGLSNLISVAAEDGNGQLISQSNFGERTVHLLAPGLAIVSASHRGGTTKMSGTSQATAFVSGLAAKIWSHHPRITSPTAIRQLLQRSAHQDPRLRSKIQLGARANPLRALHMRDSSFLDGGIRLKDVDLPDLDVPWDHQSPPAALQ